MPPRFVLQPWEFTGFPHSPFADSVMNCEWNGKPVYMRLKVRENLLFFSPTNEREGRLFAVTIPVDVSEAAANGWKTRPDALIEKFKEALSSGDWGRCVFIRFNSHLNFNARLPMVMALVRLDGRVWIRRLFDDDWVRSWLDWEDGPSFGLSKENFMQWPHATLRRFLLSQIARELRVPFHIHLSGAADKRRAFGPVWTKGDEETMLRWLTLATKVFVNFNSHSIVRYSHVTSNGSINFVVHAGNAALASFVEHNAAFVYEPSRPLRQLWKLILREQRVFAAASSDTPYQSLSGLTRFSFPISFDATTQHERLEAMLGLRDAVRGSSIERKVESILRQAQN